MIEIIKKQWSNVIFVILLILVLNPSSKEWLIKSTSFSPSLNSKEERIYHFNWKLKGLNTKNVNLADFKGKVVFVNFWATWCPPCRAEMPAIQSLYEAYKDKVVFLFVSNESISEITPFFNKYNYNLPVYNSQSEVPLELDKTNNIPASYIINKKGEIVVSKTGAASWDSSKSFELIEELLLE